MNKVSNPRPSIAQNKVIKFVDKSKLFKNIRAKPTNIRLKYIFILVFF